MTSPTLKPQSLFTKDQHGLVDWFVERDTAGAWADVGTGKTAGSLTAVDRLLNRFDCNRTLVVGPRLVAERVWSTEVTEWEHLTHLRVVRVVGTPKQRLRAMEQPADIHVISRDNVQWLEEQFIRSERIGRSIKRTQIRRLPWDTLILDESQSFKSQDSKRFKSINRLRILFQRVYLLSGSLIPNGYRDYWAQIYLLDRGARLGRTEEAFLKTYFHKEVNDGIPSYTLRDGADKIIDEKVSDLIYVMRDSQPPVPRNFITVDLSKSERALYNKMVRTSVLELGGKQITAVNSGVLWGKLLQMANGAVYGEDREWHLIHDRKIEALLELLEALPRPVLLGYGFVHDLERVAHALDGRDLGRVGIIRTNRSLDDWRAGRIDIGLMHPASAGHGLNDLYVSGCRHVVWFGFTPNREWYDQLNGRIAGGHRRTGRDVRIHHIVAANTVDEDAKGLIDFKGDQQVNAQIRIAKRIAEGQ